MPEFSRIFHRANDQIKLRDLKPGTNYSVDLIFPRTGLTSQTSTTKVSNTVPITFTTLPKEGL